MVTETSASVADCGDFTKMQYGDEEDEFEVKVSMSQEDDAFTDDGENIEDP